MADLKTAIAVHSYKGGTGKTMLSINLASILAKRGYRVALLDLDMGAPSLQTYVNNTEAKSLNEFFLGSAELEDVIFDATELLGKKIEGKLFLGLSSSRRELITAIQHRDRQAQINDLYVLMGIVRQKLPKDPWNIDVVILDTNPGISNSSINSIAVSTHLVVAMKIINGDITGTLETIQTINSTLNLNTSILINQIPIEALESPGEDHIKNLVKSQLIDKIQKNENITFGGILPLDSAVLAMETEYALQDPLNKKIVSRPVHSLKSPKSKFSDKLEEFVDLLEKQFGGN